MCWNKPLVPNDNLVNEIADCASALPPLGRLAYGLLLAQGKSLTSVIKTHAPQLAEWSALDDVSGRLEIETFFGETFVRASPSSTSSRRHLFLSHSTIYREYVLWSSKRQGRGSFASSLSRTLASLDDASVSRRAEMAEQELSLDSIKTYVTERFVDDPSVTFCGRGKQRTCVREFVLADRAKAEEDAWVAQHQGEVDLALARRTAAAGGELDVDYPPKAYKEKRTREGGIVGLIPKSLVDSVSDWLDVTSSSSSSSTAAAGDPDE